MRVVLPIPSHHLSSMYSQSQGMMMRGRGWGAAAAANAAAAAMRAKEDAIQRFKELLMDKGVSGDLICHDLI